MNDTCVLIPEMFLVLMWEYSLMAPKLRKLFRDKCPVWNDCLDGFPIMQGHADFAKVLFLSSPMLDFSL